MPKKPVLVEPKFFDEKTKELTRTFFAVRLIVFFIVLPLLDLLWTRATYTDRSDLGWFDRLVSNTWAFDATHFRHVMKWKDETSEPVGYSYEINHAFFPFFPYLIFSISKYLGSENAVTLLGFVF
jgi:hypothetical protein